MKKHGIRRLRGPDGQTDVMDHYESAPGQRTPTLCGWEGGYFVRVDPDIQAPFCPDCAAIMAWAKKVKP